MSEQTRFLKAVTTIRKARQMTLNQFIQGVTSERSFRRYLNGNISMLLTIAQKITERLNLSFMDIYAFYRNEPVTQEYLTRIMHAIHYQINDEITTYISKLQNIKVKEKGINRFLSLMLVLAKNKHDKAKALETIKLLRQSENPKRFHDPFEIAIVIEQYLLKPHQRLAKQIANRLLNARHERMIDELFLRELFRFLHLAMKLDHLNEDYFSCLIERYQPIIDLAAERHIRYEALSLNLIFSSKPITKNDLLKYYAYSISIPSWRLKEDISLLKQYKGIDLMTEINKNPK
jgi:hypothetical protein